MYAVLDGLFKQIRGSAEGLPDKSGLVFPEKIVYVTVQINQFTALVQNSDKGDDYLIMVSDCLFIFANLLAKSIGMLMSSVKDKEKDDSFVFDISKEGISTSLYNNFEAIIRFTDLILAYIVTGQASSAQQYTPDFRLVAITELIRNSYELFVVAHEYSPILLGHLQKADNSDEQNSDPKNKDEIINLVINNWYEEHAADIQAAVLTINAMQGFDFATSYMGVDICLITLIILERINELLDKKSEAVSSHPPAENRRKFIFNVLSKEHKEIEGIYEINTYIVDSLWERCMYLILEIKKLFEEKLNMKITDIDYNFTRTVLYKIGE